jgi:hypothetical protein
MFSSLGGPSIIPDAQFGNVSSRAFNDPFSNIVSLGENSELSRTELLQVFRGGTYPSSALASFLHEGTHHRCFDSPVGAVLLGIEAFSRLAWSKSFDCCREGESDVEACSRNPICFNRALVRELCNFLAPMAEGLALYGELDAAPGASLAASVPHLNALAVFFEKGGESLLG